MTTIFCVNYSVNVTVLKYTVKFVIAAATLFLRKNSSSGIRLSSVFIFLLEGSSS